MSGLLSKIPKFTLKLPNSLAKAGRTMSECPLELSFSLCEDSANRKARAEELKSLQVNLPSETKEEPQNNGTSEKADNEKSDKEDNMEVTCSVSVDGQERQEFSFTLYDFDTKDKVNKQDVEKIVVRSICEALGKTLKLPPSGSRTIKVKLAISPDSSKDIDTQEQPNEVKWNVNSPERISPCKIQDFDSSKSANTASTYLMSSTTDKPLSSSPCRQQNTNVGSPMLVNVAVNEVKSTLSPKLRPVRHSRLVSIQRQEIKNNLRDHHKKPVDEMVLDNRKLPKDSQNPADEVHNHQNHRLNSRDHLPESRDRRNHYLDLAGIENDEKFSNNIPPNKTLTSSSVDPNYVCPYRILDRTHDCTKSHRIKDCTDSPVKRQSNLCHPKTTHNYTDPSQMYKTRMDADAQDDLLNLNFDLCDLVPEAKFDWERIHHRRSKSYDLHETEFHHGGGLYSPKLKQRPSQMTAITSDNAKNHLNSSPAHHHYRFKHRDKERQRAMQKVANWIAREHASNKEEKETHFLSGGFVKSPPSGIGERREHHHLHEHVHHHYYHFADF